MATRYDPFLKFCDQKVKVPIQKLQASFSRVLIMVLCTGLLATACRNEGAKKTENKNLEIDLPQASISAKPLPASNFQIQTFQNENGSWGYDILQNGKVFIHQPDKPGIGGRLGFLRKNQAQAVAELVIQKMNQGIMPPSVRAHEIDSLLYLFP